MSFSRTRVVLLAVGPDCPERLSRSCVEALRLPIAQMHPPMIVDPASVLE